MFTQYDKTGLLLKKIATTLQKKIYAIFVTVNKSQGSRGMFVIVNFATTLLQTWCVKSSTVRGNQD